MRFPRQEYWVDCCFLLQSGAGFIISPYNKFNYLFIKMVFIEWSQLSKEYRLHQRNLYNLPRILTTCSALCLECFQTLTHPYFAWPSPIQLSHLNVKYNVPREIFHESFRFLSLFSFVHLVFQTEIIFYIQCLWILLDCKLLADRKHFCFVDHSIIGANTMPGMEDAPTQCYWMCTSMQLLHIRVGSMWREMMRHCHR